MGRARRNQRDAIRKQRAAKRRKRGAGESEDEDDTNIDYLFAKKMKRQEKALYVQRKKSDSNDQHTNISENEPSTFQTPSTQSEETNKDILRPTKKPETLRKSEHDTESRPNYKSIDKVERMRLKKQQQKARRREKKAAKAQQQKQPSRI
jgi:hypothetical protein